MKKIIEDSSGMGVFALYASMAAETLKSESDDESFDWEEEQTTRSICVAAVDEIAGNLATIQSSELVLLRKDKDVIVESWSYGNKYKYTYTRRNKDGEIIATCVKSTDKRMSSAQASKYYQECLACVKGAPVISQDH